MSNTQNTILLEDLQQQHEETCDHSCHIDELGMCNDCVRSVEQDFVNLPNHD